MDNNIIGSDDPKNRDQSKIKTCKQCGRLYHPRKNSYQAISNYCSQECAKKARQKGGSYFSLE